MSVPILTIDAFTAQPFAGNPAAVCWLDEPREAGWMQAVAAELGLSETAFVGPHAGGHSLRWFTPRVEVPICGHATLASAHMLFSTGRADRGSVIRFQTASGELTATRTGDRIELDFPAVESVVDAAPADVVAAMAVASAETRSLRDPRPEPHWIFRLESEQELRAATPDFRALAATRASVLLTAPSETPEYDFVSRYFAPSAGIDEDPVTGFAHCMLAPLWGEGLGRKCLTGFQASQRGGVVSVEWQGSRVKLRGQAVTVIEGMLHA